MVRYTLSLFMLLAGSLTPACKSSPQPPDPSSRPSDVSRATRAAASCTTEKRQQVSQFPISMRQPSYWLSKVTDADKVLLSPQTINSLNATNAKRPWAFQDVTAPDIAATERVEKELRERHEWLLKRLNSGKYVEARKGDFARAKQRIQGAASVDEFRVLLKPHDLRCIPMQAALYSPPIDPRFDRNQCSGLHTGQTVRVLRRSHDRSWWYVHAGHSVGWLHAPQTTPPITAAQAREFRDHTPRLVAIAKQVTLTPHMTLRMGSSLPIIEHIDAEVVISIPTSKGLVKRRMAPPKGTSIGYRPFTRREVYERALTYLDYPYGWGERDGGQDCSRLMLDVFATFGLHLGRHSGEQAKAGVRTVDLEGLDIAARREEIRRSMREGVVFAYMPGHIMLMLGEEDDRIFAVSAIADFSEPCDGPSDRQVQVDRVVISDMMVGDRTEKKSFIKRLRRLAVFSTR